MGKVARAAVLKLEAPARVGGPLGRSYAGTAKSLRRVRWRVEPNPKCLGGMETIMSR